MDLLKLTSVDGLTGALTTINTNIGNANQALATINGDASTPGSLDEQEAELKAYADSKVDGIDLSQVALNKEVITTINGDVTIEGSTEFKIDACKTDAMAAIVARATALSDRITDSEEDVAKIVGDVNVPGSIAYEIAQVVGSAPAAFKTLKLIGDKLVQEGDSITALIGTIADNKDALDAEVATLEDAVDDLNDAIAQGISNIITTAKAQTNVAIRAYDVTAKAKFFQVANLFSELDSDTKRATARANIGLLSTTETDDLVTSLLPIYKTELKTVVDGFIELDTRVQPEHIDYIHKLYPGSAGIAENAYDNILIMPDTVAGKYKVFLYADNDLDGEEVLVKYVIDRTLSA